MERLICQLVVFGIGATITANSDNSHTQVLGVGFMMSTTLLIAVEQLLKKARNPG